MKPLVFLLICCHLVSNSEAIWDWFWFSSNNIEDNSKGSDAGETIIAPFEMKNSDEKFLAEAEKYGLKLSELDICHHKIIMYLKTSCSSLTEEEVGKLSVRLLNCQSAVEGRPIYPCRENMKLRDCTKSMDQDTWNAYHIVSNRARAVCYVSRQLQFSLKTEMTVNKLASTAEKQLGVMRVIEEGQGHIKDLTERTIDMLNTGHKELFQSQERLKVTQQYLQTYVRGNLRELTREKALIATGNKELAQMTETIKEKLDAARDEIQAQAAQRQNNHNEILDDLSEIHKRAKELWDKLDNSTSKLVKKHQEASQKFDEALQSLVKLNETMSYLLTRLDTAKIELDSRLARAQNWMNSIGLQMDLVYSCVLHVGYFLFAAILIVFLNVPVLTRVAMVILLPINAFLEISHAPSLDFGTLTLVLFSICTGHYLSRYIFKYLDIVPLSFTKGFLSRNGSRHAIMNGSIARETNSNHLPGSSSWDDRRNGNLNFGTPTTNRMVPNGNFTPSYIDETDRRSATPSVTSHASSDSRPQCSSMTRAGKACKRKSINGQSFCQLHFTQQG